MLTFKLFEFGSANGTIYDFSLKDDILPMHVHDDTDNHITIVARGSLRAHGEGWERILNAGDVVNWEPFQQHEFIAIEDNTRIVNIRK